VSLQTQFYRSSSRDLRPVAVDPFDAVALGGVQTRRLTTTPGAYRALRRLTSESRIASLRNERLLDVVSRSRETRHLA
jgi:hypothetical protein